MDQALQNWFHACEPDWEAPLAGELIRSYPDATHELVSPGWVRSERMAAAGDEPMPIALAVQCLPNTVSLSEVSISALAGRVGQELIARLSDHESKWRLHVCRASVTGAAGSGRIKLVREAVLQHLQRKQRRLLRLLVEEDEQPWSLGEAIAQVGLIDRELSVLSVAGPEDCLRLRRNLSRFSGGKAPLASTQGAPSRAVQKLAEVELRMARTIVPGEQCIDLGASPGGWTWWAAQRGAEVLAVDRSPLRDDLMKHPRVRFQKGDAFNFKPDEPVDWLLSDVACFPERVAELLERWIGAAMCRQFCITIKFRGREEYAALEPLKIQLAAYGAEFCLRRLTANKNEVTAFGYTSPSGEAICC